MTPAPLPLFTFAAERDAALKQVAANAGKPFIAQAMRFVVNYLKTRSEASGEDITDAVWNAGIQAHDRRAMGPVFMALLKDGLIEKCGTCIRRRGHGTQGGSVYRSKV